MRIARRRDGARNNAAGLFAGGGGFGFVGAHEWNINGMLGQEPHLKFIGADDIADQNVVGAVVAGVIGLLGGGARRFQDDFVGFGEARNLHGHFFAAARRTWNHSGLGDIRRPWPG